MTNIKPKNGTNIISIIGSEKVGKTTLAKSLYPNISQIDHNLYKSNKDKILILESDVSSEKNLISDNLIYVIDNNFVFNKKDLNNLSNNLKKHYEAYSNKINIIFVINKCDLIDYSITYNGKLQLNEYYNKKFNNLENDIRNIFSDNDNINLSFITFLGDIAYIVSNLSLGKNISNEYIDKLGVYEHGKRKWQKYNSSTKAQFYKDQKKEYRTGSISSEQRKLSGLKDLSDLIFVDNSSQLKIDILINYINWDNFNLLTEYVTLCPTEYNKVVFTSYFMNNFDTNNYHNSNMITDNLDNAKTSDAIDNLIKKLKEINNILSNYSDILINYNANDISKNIVTKLKEYYLNEIQDVNDLNEGFKIITELKKYDYKSMNNIYMKLFDNCIDKEKLFDDPESMVNLVNSFKQKNFINEADVQDILSVLVLLKIKYISENLINFDDKRLEYYFAYLNLLELKLRQLSILNNQTIVQVNCALRYVLQRCTDVIISYGNYSLYLISPDFLNDNKILYLENLMIDIKEENNNELKSLEEVILSDSDISDCKGRIYEDDYNDDEDEDDNYGDDSDE